MLPRLPESKDVLEQDPSYVPAAALQANEEAKAMSDEELNGMSIPALQAYIKAQKIDGQNEEAMTHLAIAQSILESKIKQKENLDAEAAFIAQAIGDVQAKIEKELREIGEGLEAQIEASNQYIRHIRSIQPVHPEVDTLEIRIIAVTPMPESKHANENDALSDATEATKCLRKLLQIAKEVRDQEISKRSLPNISAKMLNEAKTCQFKDLKNALDEIDQYILKIRKEVQEAEAARLRREQEEKGRISQRLDAELQLKINELNLYSQDCIALFNTKDVEAATAQLKGENEAILAEVPNRPFHSDKISFLNTRIRVISEKIEAQKKINAEAASLAQKIQAAREKTNRFIDETLGRLGLTEEKVQVLAKEKDLGSNADHSEHKMEDVSLSEKLKSDLTIKENSKESLDAHNQTFAELAATVATVEATMQATTAVIKSLARGNLESTEDLAGYTQSLRLMAIESLISRNGTAIQSIYTLVNDILQHRIAVNPLLKKEEEATQKLATLRTLNETKANIRAPELLNALNETFNNGKKRELDSFIKTLDTDIASEKALAKKAAAEKEKQDKLAEKERQKAAAEKARQEEKQRQQLEKESKVQVAELQKLQKQALDLKNNFSNQITPSNRVAVEKHIQEIEEILNLQVRPALHIDELKAIIERLSPQLTAVTVQAETEKRLALQEAAALAKAKVAAAEEKRRQDARTQKEAAAKEKQLQKLRARMEQAINRLAKLPGDEALVQKLRAALPQISVEVDLTRLNEETENLERVAEDKERAHAELMEAKAKSEQAVKAAEAQQQKLRGRAAAAYDKLSKFDGNEWVTDSKAALAQISDLDKLEVEVRKLETTVNEQQTAANQEAALKAKVLAHIEKASREAKVEEERLGKIRQAETLKAQKEAAAMAEKLRALSEKNAVEEAKRSGTQLIKGADSSAQDITEKMIIEKAKQNAKGRIGALERLAAKGSTENRLAVIDAQTDPEFITNGYTNADMAEARSQAALAAMSRFRPKSAVGIAKSAQVIEANFDEEEENKPGMFN